MVNVKENRVDRDKILAFLLDGGLKFATVSGVWTTKKDLIRYVDEHVPAIDMITTKSYQVHANPGNREPVIGEVDVGSYVNAVGLRNPGMKEGCREIKALREERPLRALLNISLSGNSPEEFIRLVKKFADLADILELNFSCPHAKPGYGASIGVNADLVREYMQKIRPETDALLFPKLTPNVDHIGEIAKAAVDAGADGIAAVNTVGPEAYREPVSGELLLYNPDGHKGGLSGEHIFDTALRKLVEIREVLGPGVPLIGMGGISRGDQVRAFREAGVNVVGIGSVTARIKAGKHAEYFASLKFDTENFTDTAAACLSVKRLANYKPYTVQKAEHLSDSMMTLTLDGDRMLFKTSQYAFVWIPGVGEKPLGIVASPPLRFMVRKREYDPETPAGDFTHAMFGVREGDTLYVRGPYGAQAPEPAVTNILIVSGGTGLALVPRLVEHLTVLGHIVRVYHGVREEKEAAFRDLIERYASFNVIPDRGKPGRVLDAVSEELGRIDVSNCAFYTIGPDAFMEKAMDVAVEKGCRPENCFASLETNTMCGIGICGECECGGVMSCKDGTFFDRDFLKRHYFHTHKEPEK